MSNPANTPTPLSSGPDRRSRHGSRALWVVAVGAVASLVAADLFPQALENRSQPYLALAAASFVVQTLQLHIGLACVLCLTVAAVRRRWRLALVAAMGVMLGVAPTAWSLATRGRGAPAPAGATMRLMSLNVFPYNRDAAALVDAVRHAEPDVLVLQAYAVALDVPLREALTDEYPYQLRKPRDDSDGWAVFSRRPLLAPIDTAVQLHESKRQAQFAVRMGSTDVLVYALHLTCPTSMERIGQNRAEVADLVDRVAGEGRPVIVAGDLNFTDASANAAALRAAGLRSTHDLAGDGLGSTRRFGKVPLASRLPGFRIDHVYVNPRLTCTNSRVLEPAGSDYRPIIADIALAAQAPPTGQRVASAK